MLGLKLNHVSKRGYRSICAYMYSKSQRRGGRRYQHYTRTTFIINDTKHLLMCAWKNISCNKINYLNQNKFASDLFNETFYFPAYTKYIFGQTTHIHILQNKTHLSTFWAPYWSLGVGVCSEIPMQCRPMIDDAVWGDPSQAAMIIERDVDGDVSQSMCGYRRQTPHYGDGSISLKIQSHHLKTPTFTCYKMSLTDNTWLVVINQNNTLHKFDIISVRTISQIYVFR